jgi:hypothetical protein
MCIGLHAYEPLKTSGNLSAIFRIFHVLKIRVICNLRLKYWPVALPLRFLLFQISRVLCALLRQRISVYQRLSAVKTIFRESSVFRVFVGKS